MWLPIQTVQKVEIERRKFKSSTESWIKLIDMKVAKVQNKIHGDRSGETSNYKKYTQSAKGLDILIF